MPVDKTQDNDFKSKTGCGNGGLAGGGRFSPVLGISGRAAIDRLELLLTVV
jgi:hypothetical protein